MSEDLDPIEDALSWLKFIVDNGCLSPHDVPHVRDVVVPKAMAMSVEQKAEIERLKASLCYTDSYVLGSDFIG